MVTFPLPSEEIVEGINFPLTATLTKKEVIMCKVKLTVKEPSKKTQKRDIFYGCV